MRDVSIGLLGLLPLMVTLRPCIDVCVTTGPAIATHVTMPACHVSIVLVIVIIISPELLKAHRAWRGVVKSHGLDRVRPACGHAPRTKRAAGASGASAGLGA